MSGYARIFTGPHREFYLHSVLHILLKRRLQKKNIQHFLPKRVKDNLINIFKFTYIKIKRCI